MISGGGTLVFDGKVITEPKDITFIKKFIVDDDKFALLQ